MSELNSNELTKFFDLGFWQRTQDNFSQALDLPIYTIDSKCNIVLKSKELPYYSKIIMSKKLGKELCEATRLDNFNKLKTESKGVIVYSCYTGLINIMVPINVNGVQVGAVIVDGIVHNMRNQKRCAEIAAQINVGTDELIGALDDLEVKSIVDMKGYVKILGLFSKLVPELAKQKADSDRKINELTILNKISLMVNSTLDLEKILNTIMNFMMQSINAQNCSIITFNDRRRYSIKNPSEYLLKVEKSLVKDVKETKSTIRLPSIKSDYRFYGYNIEYNSLITFPLKLRDEVIGALNLYGEHINLRESDVEYLNIITNQVALAVSNAQQYEQIKETAITDKLTGLYNRRHFMDILINEINRSSRFKSPFSLALFDVDHFKNYNDTQGHLKGDKLLKELSDLVVSNVRSIDTVGRYGGEEFVVILPKTKPHEAKMLVERIRKSVEQQHFDCEERQPGGRITISVGLVTCMNGDLLAEEMLQESDKNLYKAKAAGRNNTKASIVVNRNIGSVEVLE